MHIVHVVGARPNFMKKLPCPKPETKSAGNTEVMASTVSKYESIPASLAGHDRHSRLRQPAAVIFISLVLASCANHLLASWLGVLHLSRGSIGVYRRVGPKTGPQIFCAGSSLLVAALSWSEVSEAFGQGIETWGIGGSAPDIWEVWQQQTPLSNTMVIGISLYDINEMHLADERATVVPLSQTLDDLWESNADPILWHRILTQYATRYVRFLFPTAGDADKVLVGVRSKIAERLGRQASLAHEGVVFEPAPPLLDAGQSTTRLSDWSSARLVRRIAVLRSENRGRSEFFNGPKHRAFHRMLLRARRQGRVIIVVLPVSRAYTEAFLNEYDLAAFERAIDEARAIAPEATIVRLDRLRGISDARYFSDLVHMNSLGRPAATQAFLDDVTKKELQPATQTTSN
jgi:hypothetical protein